MKKFHSLDKLSEGITYLQIASARISRLLLMAGLVLAMINFLLNGRLFLNPGLQETWAALQAIGVDANLWLSFAYLKYYVQERHWGMVGIHGVIGLLLLFVACVVTDIESVRQALNTTIGAASGQVIVTIPELTAIRSVVVVLLVAAGGIDDDESVLFSVSPAPSPVDEVEVDYNEYMLSHPDASVKEVASATGLSEQTVRRRRKKDNVPDAQDRRDDTLSLSVRAPA